MDLVHLIFEGGEEGTRFVKLIILLVKFGLISYGGAGGRSNYSNQNQSYFSNYPSQVCFYKDLRMQLILLFSMPDWQH